MIHVVANSLEFSTLSRRCIGNDAYNRKNPERTHAVRKNFDNAIAISQTAVIAIGMMCIIDVRHTGTFCGDLLIYYSIGQLTIDTQTHNLEANVMVPLPGAMTW